MEIWEDGILQSVDAAVSAAREGSARVVLFAGDSGSGRTSALAEVVARSEGFRVLSAQGDPQSSEPFRALSAWGARSPGQVRPTDVAFDGARELRTLLDSPGFDAPVLIVIDDVHWVDEESLEALVDVLARSAGDRLLVAVSTGLIAPDALVAWQDFVASSDSVTRVALTGLSLEVTGRLVRSTFPDASDSFIDDLWRRTDGNALYLSFLLSNHSLSALASTAALPAPADFSRELAERFTREGGDVRRLSFGMAVLGTDWMNLTDAAYVGGVEDPGHAVDVLAGYFQVFVRPGLPGVQVKVRHSMVQATVYQLIPAPLLLELHARAAEVATDETTELEHLVSAAATYDHALSVRLHDAAVKAQTRRLHRLAGRYLRWASLVEPHGGVRASLWLDSLYQQVLARDLTHVRDQLETVAGARDTVRAALVLAAVKVHDGDFAEASRILRPFGNVAGLEPLLTCRINILLAWSTLRSGGETALILEWLASAEAAGVEDPALVDEATFTSALVGRRETGAEVGVVTRSTPGMPSAGLRRLAWRGCGRVLQGNIDSGLAILRDLEQRLGHEFLMIGGGLAASFLAFAYWLEGERDLADVRFRAIVEETVGPIGPMVASLLAVSSAGRGDLERADGWLGVAEEHLRSQPWAEAVNLLLIATVITAELTPDGADRQRRIERLLSHFGADLLHPPVTVGSVWSHHAALFAVWTNDVGEATRLFENMVAPQPTNPWLARLRQVVETSLHRGSPNSLPDDTQLDPIHDAVGSIEPANVFSTLSDRERDVASLLVSGMSYVQIAQNLFVTRSTVAFHLGRIYAKTGTSSRHELAQLALSH